ncbi:putative ABC transport system permease protein [Anaerovirgula multivorans]|uniref:Putative ABC transport system permease protein n=1 Tax=Anaerovirgula multivorans TaxID=312168 RepID=A0A239D8R8_9FIRM|nr:ABC transporter permease [Anaerovirgula multivorans]SNS28689.1 putative ABC transport system permease protein [Anaerovirgula multivorans]
MIRESIKMSWQNISHNKMRSFLTTLGIVIGVTSIIALITIVQGVTGEVTNQFESLGAGKITIQAPGTPLKQGLTDNDIKRLSDIEDVEGVSPTLSIQGSVVRNASVEEGIRIEGKNEVYFQHNPDLISRGRGFNILDMESKNRVAIINETLEEDLFWGEDSIGEAMQINGTTYTVVGVTNNDISTDMMSMGGSGSESKVIIPYQTAMGIAGVGNTSSLELLVSDSNKTDEVIQNVELILNQAFNYKENSYSIINMEDLLDVMNSMTDMMTMMLAGIASIALLVGGIGIMNMMLVSVTERTTEIGLRKALGAEPKRIQLQFLIESIFLSLLGGLIGLVLGLGISWIVSNVIGFTFVPSSGAIGLGVGFSAAVGIIFGWAPARKASVLNPIDALRSV